MKEHPRILSKRLFGALILMGALLALVLAGCTPAATPTLPPPTLVGPAEATATVSLPQPPTVAQPPTVVPTAVATVATVQASPETGSAAGQALTLTILHSNDVGGWAEPCG